MPPLLTVSQCSFRFSLQRFLLLLYHGNRIVVFFCAAICSSLGRLKKLNPTNNIPIRTRPVMVFLSILILITNYINYKLPVVYHVSLAVHRCFFVFDGSFHKCNEQRMRFSTVLPYSGWNCVPTNHFKVGISTISTRSDSGLIPTHFMPAASYRSL